MKASPAGIGLRVMAAVPFDTELFA